MTEELLDRSLTVVGSTKLLLSAVLLQEVAGVPNDVLREAFSDYRPYNQFLLRAREWSQIYREPPPAEV
jgi:hypothetical protein